MKLNFGAAGSKHDKQQQNSMWEATLFTRISVKKKKKNRRRRRRRGEFQERRVAKKWKHGKEEIAQQKYSALFLLFFPLVFCFWTTTTWEKERAPRTLREKRAEENFYRFCVRRKRLRNQDKPSANFEIHLVPYSPPIFIPQCLCIKVVEVLRASPMFGNPKRALKHLGKHTQWVVNVLRSCNLWLELPINSHLEGVCL